MLTLKVILPLHALSREKVVIYANVQEAVAVGGGGSASTQAKIIRVAAL